MWNGANFSKNKKNVIRRFPLAYPHSFWSPDVWPKIGISAQQTGTPGGCTHSRGALLFGRCGPKHKGRPHLSAKPPPSLTAWLLLPDEGGSAGGEWVQKWQFKQKCIQAITKVDKVPQNSFFLFFCIAQHTLDAFSWAESQIMQNKLPLHYSQGHNSYVLNRRQIDTYSL